MDLFFALISVIAIIVGGLIVAIPSIMNYKGWISISKQQEQYQQSFDKTIEQLSSDKYTAQLSAAVLLRRFFKVKLNYHFLINKKNINENDAFFLRTETINVISSLLRTLPTGVYQKSLADGLSSCNDLSCADLQNANLQNAFLSSDSYRINMSKTDLFCANLTKALVTKIDGQGCYFRNSILCNTRFKDCDFSNASFQGADLTNAYFKNVSLSGAIFKDAVNIPKEISGHLVNGTFIGDQLITTQEVQSTRKIFFSMSGKLCNEEARMIDAYEKFLDERGFSAECYSRDHYPRFGQLTAVKSKIEQCVGMIVFGSRQILVKEGIFRPNLSEETRWENEWLSTSWNEIEVGMGIMLGLPVLLVKAPDLKTGIFDSCLSEILIDRTSSAADLREISTDENLLNWLSKLPGNDEIQAQNTAESGSHSE